MWSSLIFPGVHLVCLEALRSAGLNMYVHGAVIYLMYILLPCHYKGPGSSQLIRGRNPSQKRLGMFKDYFPQVISEQSHRR